MLQKWHIIGCTEAEGAADNNNQNTVSTRRTDISSDDIVMHGGTTIDGATNTEQIAQSSTLNLSQQQTSQSQSNTPTATKDTQRDVENKKNKRVASSTIGLRSQTKKNSAQQETSKQAK